MELRFFDRVEERYDSLGLNVAPAAPCCTCTCSCCWKNVEQVVYQIPV